MKFYVIMWSVLIISMVLHEVGHAEMAKRKGLVFAFYQLGIGPSLYESEKLKIKMFPVVFAAAIGVDHDIKDKDYIKGVIWTYSAGILVHLILTLIGLPIVNTDLGLCLVVTNILGIIVNGLPYKCFGNKTDGYKVITELNKLHKLKKAPA